MCENSLWYKLTPVDAWFFRDDRPYNGSEYQSGVSSVFPPHAPTVVGAIRAALARENGWSGKGDWTNEVKEILGDGFSNLGRLSFTGPFLSFGDELLFSVPSHLLGEVKGTTFTPKQWIFPSNEAVCSDISMSTILPVSHEKSEAKLSSAKDFFVTERGLESILKGQCPSRDTFHQRQSIFSLESRIGLERETSTRSAIKGALYSPQYIRMHRHYSLVIGIRGIPDSWKLPGTFPMGGESRLTHSERTSGSSLLEESGTIQADFLTLLTPACFDGEKWWGVDPGADAKDLAPDLMGSITSVCIDRYVKIGGWDSRANSPVEAKPFIRPGAVWWLGEKQEIARKSNLGIRDNYGFGLILSGNQPKKSHCEDGAK